MANKAVIVELLGDGGDPVDFTVPNAAAIEKGALVVLSGANRTVATSSSADAAGAKMGVGVAAAEKEASDGATNIAVYTHGIFDLICGQTNTALGDPVCVSGANTVVIAADTLSGASVIGKALEAGTAGNRMEVLVRV